jgi:hypothetical protein
VDGKHFARYYSTSTTNYPSTVNVMQEGPVRDWPHFSVLHINCLPPAAPASMILQHIMHCQ